MTISNFDLRMNRRITVPAERIRFVRELEAAPQASLGKKQKAGKKPAAVPT